MMKIRYFSILLMMVFCGCILVEDPGGYHHTNSEPYVEIIYEYPCTEVEPYNYNAFYCDSDWDFICCTWYIGWGCREEWCLWEDSCGWEFVDDYCVY